MTSSAEHESAQPPSESNESPLKSRVASSTSLNALSAGNSDTENSERPVREKLKNTTIAGQLSDNAIPSDHPMGDAADTNHGKGEDISSSDTDRGRLRRKRSFEEVEGDHAGKPSEKPERHTRKKSRDIKHPEPASGTRKVSAEGSVERIDEQEMEEADQSSNTHTLSNSDNRTNTKAESVRSSTPENGQSTKTGVLSPKNKRSRDDYLEGQNKVDISSTIQNQEGLASVDETVADTKALTKPAAEEPKMKRTRESSSPKPQEGEAEAPKGKSQIPFGSGFANTSATSPFASLSPKPEAKDSPSLSTLASAKSPSEGPQTSSEKFQQSSLGSFVKSSSPFGAGASASKSPFAGAGNKPSLSSFASTPSATTTPANGFAGLGSSGSAFGGSALGGSKLGGGFGAAFGSGSSSGFGALGNGGSKSWATPGGAGTITGLSNKPARPFGAAADDDDEEGGTEDENGVKSPTTTEAAFEKEDADAQDKRFTEREHETGEEDEETLWSGRAKLYHFAKENGKGQWKERGVGVLKLNVNKDTPKKPRFIMRQDGALNLVLNAAIHKTQKYGTAEGTKPTNGQFLFLSPAEGKAELEQKSLKLKPKNAEELYDVVTELQEDM